MALFHRYLDRETETLVRDGVRLSVIGRRDRLGESLVAEIERTEAATEWGDALHLRLAVDYSARAAILEAARRVGRRQSRGILRAADGRKRRRRSADPHRQRPASVGFSAVGMRFCGTVFHALSVAGFRCAGSGGGAGGVSPPQARRRHSAGCRLMRILLINVPHPAIGSRIPDDHLPPLGLLVHRRPADRRRP